MAARRSGEAARVTGTAGRTPRAHARAPSSSCILLLTLRAPEHLLLPVAPGIHRPLAPAHRQRCRYDMPWGDAATVCHGSREQDPAAPSVPRHLLEGTLARARPCLTSKRPRHASTGFKVGLVSMCAQRRSVDCRPHGRSRRAWWGCRLDTPGAWAKQHGSRPLQAVPLGSMLVHPRPPSHPPRLRAPAAACSSWYPPASRAGSWPAPSV